MDGISAAAIDGFGITSSPESRLKPKMEATDAGDAARTREAFPALVERHARMVFRVAYRITGNEHDAEDVVQETFLRAHRNLGRFDSRAGFSTWIYRIATNCAIDVLRSRRRRSEDPLDHAGSEGEGPASEAPRPDDAAHGSEIQSRVLEALDGLSPQERAAFVLRHFEGRSIDEIGSTLGVGANAAKQTVFRAVRKLRLRLEPLREKAP